MKLRILLADDHEIVRRGLCALLEKHEGWEVCGEAADGREALEMAKRLKPDVVIVDIGMLNLNGLDTTRQLLQHDPQFKIIVLTITDSDQVIREALDAGAREECVASNLRFYEAVVAASHNPMFRQLSASIRIPMQVALSYTVGLPALRTLERDAHRALYEAIVRHDPQAARTAAEEIVGFAMLAVEHVMREAKP